MSIESYLDGGLTSPDGTRTDAYLEWHADASGLSDLHFVTGNASITIVECSRGDLLRLAEWIERTMSKAVRP